MTNLICPQTANDRDDVGQLYLNPRSAEHTIDQLRNLRRRTFEKIEAQKAVAGLENIRSTLTAMRRHLPRDPSSKVVYLGVESWRRHGHPGVPLRDMHDALVPFQDAFSSHPLIRGAVGDKLAAVIREIDLTIFDLCRRQRAK